MLNNYFSLLIVSCAFLPSSSQVSAAFFLVENPSPSPRSFSSRQQAHHGMTKFGPLSLSRDNDDPVVRLPLMEAELASLPKNSDSDDDGDTKREDLQRSINDAKTAAEFGVRAAQLKFYDAFSKGDLTAMKDIWSRDHHVSCVHPGMSSLEGREAVLSSWEQLFATSSQGGSSGDDKEGGSFDIEPSLVRIEICGQTAICRCIENTEGGGQLEALNMYKREGGAWKITLHMASPIVMRQGVSGAIF
jgi:ketosteroid isomerase-like protein